MHEQITRLVRAFDHQLRADMRPDDYARAVAANRLEVDRRVCHTHDYVDANESMALAFLTVTGRDVDPDSDADLTLWNSAWDAWIASTNGDPSIQPDPLDALAAAIEQLEAQRQGLARCRAAGSDPDACVREITRLEQVIAEMSENLDSAGDED